MKKVLHIGMNGSMLDEQPTGVGVYTFNLINHLSWAYRDTKGLLEVFSPTSKFIMPGIKVNKLSNLLQSSRYGKLAAISRFLWNIFYYPFLGRSFDVLISPTTHGSIVSDKQIITIHDLLSLRYNNISFHQRIYFKLYLPILISRSKVIIAVSESTKKDILALYDCPDNKVKVVYNGFDDVYYNNSPINEKQIAQTYKVSDYYLAVGPTYAHKNFERLLKAYNQLPDAIKENHPLVIAGGKSKYVSILKEYTTNLGLNDFVHFIGYVPQQLMPSLYKEASALVFPSLYEGFGFPLLEAMACGCPVLSSDTSSMPEVCGKAALYFNPIKEEEISHLMERIVKDDALRNTCKEKGLAQVKLFSWEKTAAAFKEIIESHF